MEKTDSKLIRFWRNFWFPIIWFFVIVGGSSYFLIKENNLKNEIYEKALMGDKIAISLLRLEDKPWKLHEHLIREALDGNKNAIDILDLKVNQKKE